MASMADSTALVLGVGGGGLTPEWTDAHSLRLVILIGVFIVAVVTLGVVLLMVRRRMLAGDNELAGARSLLDQLREMRRKGEMSEEEYEATRRALATKLALKVKGGEAVAPSPSYAPRAPRTSTNTLPKANRPGARLAPPGYDLTGDPLPGSSGPPGSK